MSEGSEWSEPEDSRPPPKGLGAAGRRLWRQVVADYELDAGEVRLLLEASRTVDELDRLAQSVADAPLSVPGSTGQPRANPLLDEVRRHRATLAALVGALQLPAGDEVVGATLAARRASLAARSRWRAAKEREGFDRGA